MPLHADVLALSALLLRVAQHASRDARPLPLVPVEGMSWSRTQSLAAQLEGLGLVQLVTHHELLLVSPTPACAAALDASTPAGAMHRDMLVSAVVGQHPRAAHDVLWRLVTRESSR